MKKNFLLTDPKIHRDRLVEAIKGDVRKYLKRERKKRLPEGVDFWDFDCRCGASTESAPVIHVAELIESIDAVAATEATECYIEILAKPGVRAKAPKEGVDDAG